MTQSEPPLNPTHLWAAGAAAEQIPVGELVCDRYRVLAPHIWVDTQPQQPPSVPDELPDSALPYLKTHGLRLHVPGLFSAIPASPEGDWILLLENSPLGAQGKLQPALTDVWGGAPPIRQLYWLWQMLELWTELATLDLSASLLPLENCRVEGWRLRLLELQTDEAAPSLARLADGWRSLLISLHPYLVKPVEDILTRLADPNANPATIATELNQLLLIETTQLTPRLQVAGGTSAGSQRRQNEDACYPSRNELNRTSSADLPLLPRLGIVCDGIGGHEGGEVASQMAVRSLQLQLRAMLHDLTDQEETLPPEVVSEQLAAIIRVVNNLIASQNDSQGRASRQRMGTTLVMALHLPQKVLTPQGWETVNELYVAHVGDSRAYWITPNYCQLLTVDDDIAGRHTQMGRVPYRQACQQANAGALSQALGTRDAEFLHPHIQRFIVEEDGVLLLCSDGLSDHNRVEESWANFIGLIIKDIIPLEAAVESWIELAEQKNGHDNISVVLMLCRVSPEPALLPQPGELLPVGLAADAELTAASRALLYPEGEPAASAADSSVSEPAVTVKPISRWQAATIGLVVGITMLMGLVIWWQRQPPTPEPGSPPPVGTP